MHKKESESESEKNNILREITFILLDASGIWNDGYSFTGCKPCNCVEAGSLSVQCHNSTGQCSCKANTTGTLCDTCVNGYFGLPTSPCQG